LVSWYRIPNTPEEDSPRERSFDLHFPSRNPKLHPFLGKKHQYSGQYKLKDGIQGNTIGLKKGRHRRKMALLVSETASPAAKIVTLKSHMLGNVKQQRRGRH